MGISSAGGVVWFTELLAGQLGRIHSDGTIEEFPLPDRTAKPHAVAAAQDGTCWTTLWAAGSVAQLSPTGELLRELPLGPDSEPHGLTLTPTTLWTALESGTLAALPL